VATDVKRSKRFYSELLRGLGWAGVLDREGERGETIWYLQAQDTWIGLREKQSHAHPVPYDRYAVGIHHVAFEASSREAVDHCCEWVLRQDVETESAPKEFPHYVEGYYAAFFFDPDGIKLEVVHEPTRASITSA
jgi:catechol 2,3-dioxygenase-like lactoylglutathione lyase family enzyme